MKLGVKLVMRPWLARQARALTLITTAAVPSARQRGHLPDVGIHLALGGGVNAAPRARRLTGRADFPWPTADSPNEN
jgi:hypothetical protein